MNKLYLYTAILDRDNNGNYIIFKLIKDNVIEFNFDQEEKSINISKTTSGRKHLFNKFSLFEKNIILGCPPYLYILSDNIKFKKDIINVFNLYINNKNNK